MTQKPGADEYAPYYGRYIDLIGEGDIVDRLELEMSETLALIAAFGEEKAGYRYAPGKWNVAEVLGHINDTERVFASRALRAARGDRTPQASFDQDAYAAANPAGRMTMRQLEQEFRAVRMATVTLLEPLTDEDFLKRTVVNQNDVTLRALAWMIAGHERHHCNILRERYLAPKP